MSRAHYWCLFARLLSQNQHLCVTIWAGVPSCLRTSPLDTACPLCSITSCCACPLHPFSAPVHITASPTQHLFLSVSKACKASRRASVAALSADYRDEKRSTAIPHISSSSAVCSELPSPQTVTGHVPSDSRRGRRRSPRESFPRPGSPAAGRDRLRRHLRAGAAAGAGAAADCG